VKITDSEREQVRTVATRWRKAYLRNGAWFVNRNNNANEIHKQLEGLDVETSTAADVAAIIGNSSWAEPQRCDECGARQWPAVQLGEEPDYESNTAVVCVDCLRKALELVGGMA
jgi:hypothetical protein